MYTLDCSYYNREFNSIPELINDILMSGMDPNYPIIKTDQPNQEYGLAADYITL